MQIITKQLQKAINKNFPSYIHIHISASWKVCYLQKK